MTEDRCELLCLDLETAEAVRTALPPHSEIAQVANEAKALSDPNRVTIAFALSQAAELCVCDLAWITKQSQNLVSHHLRMMRSAGVLESRREGKMVFYSLASAGASALSAFNAESYGRS